MRALALSAVEGLLLLAALPACAAPSTTTVTLGSELRLERPSGWKLDDQWFRKVPFAVLAPAAGGTAAIRIERYDAENPLHLTPKSFPDALATGSSMNPVFREAALGARKIPVYEVLTRGQAPRAPDADAYGDVLGGGKPGVRSKEARCVRAGAYDYAPAYNDSLKDKKAAADFRKTFLEGGHLTKVIEACLGAAVLATMRRGEPLKDPPRAPSEKELARLEAADRTPLIAERWESVAVVEQADRFYLVRLTGSKKDYFDAVPLFDRVLGSLRFLP